MKMASKDRSIQARKFQSDFKPDIHLRPHTNFPQKKQMEIQEAFTGQRSIWKNTKAIQR